MIKQSNNRSKHYLNT